MNHQPNQPPNQRPINTNKLQITPNRLFDPLTGIVGIPTAHRIADQAGDRLAVFIDQRH